MKVVKIYVCSNQNQKTGTLTKKKHIGRWLVRHEKSFEQLNPTRVSLKHTRHLKCFRETETPKSVKLLEGTYETFNTEIFHSSLSSFSVWKGGPTQEPAPWRSEEPEQIWQRTERRIVLVARQEAADDSHGKVPCMKWPKTKLSEPKAGTIHPASSTVRAPNPEGRHSLESERKTEPYPDGSTRHGCTTSLPKH